MEEFPSSFPSLSFNVDWRERERERMTLSGLECEVCVIHFEWIKGERGGFRIQFVKVYV